MSEVRVGPFGFEYDAKNHEVYVISYFDNEAEEGEHSATIDHVNSETWESFSGMLLGLSIGTRYTAHVVIEPPPDHPNHHLVSGDRIAADVRIMGMSPWHAPLVGWTITESNV